MEDHFSSVAEAFSRKASVYDSFGQGHEHLTRMREIIYRQLESTFTPGSTLLELNAGTGADAVAMVERGYRVHATDLSGAMVAEVNKKIVENRLEGILSVQQCSFTELEKVSGGPFDGAYSNFGGLNCINDLALVARKLPALLQPGSAVVLVIMPRICPWELFHFFKDPRTATRRLRRSGVEANVEGVRFLTTYHSASQAIRAFHPEFEREKLRALSLVTPTADNKTFAGRFPRSYRRLVKLDDLLSPVPPFRGWGDFFCLTLRYRGDHERR